MNEILQFIFDLGAAVLLPFVIFIIGLIVGAKPSKAFTSGLMVGIGFVGIGLIIGLMLAKLGPAAKDMANNLGLTLNVIDLGWPGMSPMTWKTSIASLAIPVAIAVNIIMLVTGLTKVINIDIWNLWHMAFTGAIVQIATGSLMYGVIGIVVHAAIAYKFGDWFKHETKEYFGLEGISVPHGSSAYNGPFAVIVDEIIEKTPLRNIHFTATDMTNTLGIFGQPIMMGAILGGIIGQLAGYELKQTLQLAIEMAGVMYFMPIVVKPIMVGLLPISEAAKTKLAKKFGKDGGEFTLGMDPALLLGESSVVATSLFFIPLTLIIAIIMPGNRVLPFGDLPTIGFFVAMAVAIHKGNLFRSLISGSLIITINLWIANQTIGWQTQMGTNVGVVKAGVEISSLDQGGAPITYILAELFTGTNLVGLIVISSIYIIGCILTWLRCKRLDKLS